MLSGFCPARFGVLFCSVVLWHHHTVALLCMLFKIGWNPMHPLYGALPVPYVPVWVTRSAVIAHLYTYAPPRYRTSQYILQDFYSLVNIPVERSWWPRIRWCGVGGFQEQGQCLFIGLAASSLFVSCCFTFFSFILWDGIVGLWSSDW